MHEVLTHLLNVTQLVGMETEFEPRCLAPEPTFSSYNSVSHPFSSFLGWTLGIAESCWFYKGEYEVKLMYTYLIGKL